MHMQLKPNIVASKCLGFEHCRYNGQIIPFRLIEKLNDHVEFRPVCPEMEIGLGVPRDPIRIILDNEQPRLFQPATNRDVTELMKNFIKTFMNTIDQVDGFILKNRSPSCGIHDVKIYTGFEQSIPSKKGSGFFGGAVLNIFQDIPIEDEGRLTNFTIREHFLTKLFTFARFRQVKADKTMKSLIAFHSHHKLLLLAYNQSRYRLCGRIVANHEKFKFNKVIDLYGQELKNIFRKIPKVGSIINTLMHAFGGFSKYLSPQEKRFLLNSIEEYRDERIPLSTLNHLIHGYAIRFNTQYLLNQVFINPYPRELVEITNSGKGRNY